MLRRLKDAGLVWPTLASVLALGLLVALGTWQLQRKQWKEGLIATIAARTQAAPIELTPDRLGVVAADAEYLHVVVTGRFDHGKERYLYAPAAGGLGWHVYTPLEMAPGNYIWINRGFVPDAHKDPASRPQGQVPGEVRVTGLIRLTPARGQFTPDNDVRGNLWLWPDIAAMTASAFAGTPVQVPAFRVEADALPEPPGGLPKGGVTRLELPNRHLEYAVTWYGLALTLIGVYCVFAAGRFRPR